MLRIKRDHYRPPIESPSAELEAGLLGGNDVVELDEDLAQGKSAQAPTLCIELVVRARNFDANHFSIFVAFN